MKKAIVILPTYNEKDNVGIIIPQILEQQKNIPGWELEILVVDDNSPDNTAEYVKELQKKYKKLHLISGKKEGLGKAYVRGFRHVLQHLLADAVFEMDADLSHDPSSIPDLLKKLDQGFDIVLGARYIKGGSIPKNWALYRKIFSFCGNLVVRLGFMHLKIHDWTNGFRVIRTSLLPEILEHLENYNGYVFQIALIDRAVKLQKNIGEVPINFQERNAGSSKISSGRYIFDILTYIFQHSSFIKFGIVGLIGAILDFGTSFMLIERFAFAVWLATVISAELAIISNFFLNNYWSFSHKKVDNSLTSMFKSLIQFNTISLGNIVIQAALLQTATNIFPKEFWYIYKVIIIALVIIPYSYFLYNKVVWKKK